ncbi:MAG: hypothetical protein ACETV1_06105, partial [Candidatus Bathyarchaeia archaeon]
AFYYTHFYENPENIVKIIRQAVDLGIMGVQVLPFPRIFSALKAVERELGERLTVAGTIGPDDPLGNIQDYQRFKTFAMLLHGQVTDGRDTREISRLLDEVRAANCLAGVATHKPLSTLEWLTEMKLDVDLVMLPFNQLGMFMDASPKKVAEAIKGLHKPVIGKKILAAGYLRPEGALTFVSQFPCIDVVALGIASEQEAKETLTAAANAFSGTVDI